MKGEREIIRNGIEVRARERLLGMVLMTDDFTRNCTHEWGGLMPFWFPRVQLLAQDPNVRPAVRTLGYEWCLSTLKRLPAVPASQVVCHFTHLFLNSSAHASPSKKPLPERSGEQVAKELSEYLSTL